MKKTLVFIFSIAVATITAQTNRTDTAVSGITDNIVLAANGANTQAYGASSYWFNPKRQVDGSVRLFDGWTNKAIIYTVDGQKFSVGNINLNLEQNAFESKFSKDSLFTFSFNNIEQFVVNNKVFKNYYYDGENKVFQELYTGNEIQVLKGYKIRLVKGSDNPMLSRSRDKYVQKEYYYVRKNGAIHSLKLRKKDLMKFVADEDQAKKILGYVKSKG